MHISRALLGVLVGISLTACGGNEVTRPTIDVTIGQQLIDLNHAYKSGALSEREYDRQRRQLIDSAED